MTERLKYLGVSVCDKNLVMYAVNGFGSRYMVIPRLIRHCEPLPTFETTRKMLLLEETTLKEQNNLHSAITDSTVPPVLYLFLFTNSSRIRVEQPFLVETIWLAALLIVLDVEPEIYVSNFGTWEPTISSIYRSTLRAQGEEEEKGEEEEGIRRVG
ncbi:hypothetical protein Tco_0986928 [Tanacetum coccineum]